MIRRIIPLIILLIMCVPLAKAKTVVTHMHYANHNLNWLQWLQDRASAFETLNPDIEIDIFVSVDGSGVNQLIAMAATGTMPDVTEMALAYGASLAGRGFFQDLKPFIVEDPDVDMSMFVPIAEEALTWTNGELWGLPADVHTAPTFFNKSMMAEAGLVYPNQLGDSWNWETLREYGRKLSRDTDFDGAFDRKAITGMRGMWDHMAVVRQNGGLLFDRYKDPTASRLNTPEVQGAIQWLVDLYRNDGIVEDGWFGLSQGTSAIDLVSGPANIKVLNDAGIHFDVALQPLGPANRGAYTVINSFQITKDSENPDAAWRWIKFLATDMESVESFVLTTGRLPAFLPVAQYYGRLIENPPDNVWLILENVLDPASFHLPIGPKAQDARNVLLSRRDAVMAGHIDVISALEDVHRQVSTILSAED